MPLLTMAAERRQPLEAADRIVQVRYGSADMAFLGNSVLGDARTANSDLDVVVIGERLGAPYRETFIAEGWPVEAFVHDAQSWTAYRDKELRERRVAMTPIVAYGAALQDRGGANGVRAEATRLLQRGPPALDHGAQERMRYALFDVMLDLEVSADAAEQLMIAGDVVALVADLRCDLARLWPGRGKRLLRPLQAADPDLGVRIAAALRAVPAGSVAPLIDVALETLELCGGVVFDGFRQAGTRTP